MKQFFLFLILLNFSFQLFSQSIDELILNKKYEKALSRVSEKIQEKPEGSSFFKQAMIYEAQSNLTEAVKSLEKALFYEPENSTYLAELGDSYSSLGNVWQAIDAYQRAVRLSPSENSFKGKLGKAFLNVDDYKNAYQTFESIFKTDSANVLYNKQFAFAAYKIGKASQAIVLYEQVIEENPGDFGSHLNLIAVYKKMKDVNGIVHASERAMSVFPGNSAILIRQAEALFELREFEKALYPYEQYLAENDSALNIMKMYGIALYLSNNEEKALGILEDCFYKAPNDQFVNFYIGLAYKKKKDFERSAEFLNSAIECSKTPYLSEMYHHLGQVYGLQREYEKSIAALQKAFEYNHENFEALFEIATTYEEFNFNKTMALNYYSEYLKTAGIKAKNADYALERMQKIKEEMFLGDK
jgi:tetratricopeptide (TPR) repeat protein